jgi:hypothetical protein
MSKVRHVKPARAVGRTVLLACVLGAASWAGLARQPGPATAFAAEIARLSEPEGAFDTDNLISNERSYLDVVPALAGRGASGGAYIGVGPDQNFSYIARVRPTVAYIIDIRRDNLLLHLLFKALFARAGSRVEYLSLLTGRAPPGWEDWRAAPLERIVAYVEQTRAEPDRVARLRADLHAAIAAFGVPLSRADLATIDRFHRTFIDQDVRLRFHSHGRPPRPHYPTFRELLLARDAGGRSWNYLAAEEDFQFVRALQARDGVVPVVGDLSGPHALRAIGRAIAARGERVSAFYVSNVETYLARDGAYARFLSNVAELPRDGRSVIIRSFFGAGSSLSTVDAMDDMLAGRR